MSNQETMRAQLAQQGLRHDYQPSCEELAALAILRPIEIADKMYSVGSADHHQVLGAALMNKWPQIKYMLERAAGLHRI